MAYTPQGNADGYINTYNTVHGGEYPTAGTLMTKSSTTYEATGNREDLLDIITNISPDETPLMNKFGRSKVTGMVHSWLTDTLPAAGTNAQYEDAPFSDTEMTPRVKLDNYVQIFMRDCSVTDSQEAVLKAGVKSEMALVA